jgi:hypothetical protein
MVRREKNSPKVAPAKSSRLEEIVATQRVLLQEISGSEINLDPPSSSSFQFPCLENIEYASSNSFMTLLSSCTVLEDLTLIRDILRRFQF